MPSRFQEWRDRRRRRKFEAACDRLGIPEDVRVRMRKLGMDAPHWYAGRQVGEAKDAE